jgi:cell division protease FtsH
MSQREKENTAYHESGHAVVGGLTPNSDPVHKVTIIPRGMALGLTWSLPDEDRHSQTKNELFSIVKRMLAGRIAEEIKFGDVTTGASNDFEKASELARRMVTQFGMSELGPITFGRGAHQVFLGRDIGEERNYSEEVASQIDNEVRKIIESSYENGKRILTENWAKVERMVASLMEYETVETEEVRAILDDKPYDRERNQEITTASDSSNDRPAADETKRAEKPARFPPKISPEPA